MEPSKNKDSPLNGQRLVLLFRKDKAFLTLDHPLSFDRLGLPEVAQTFHNPAYWTISVISHFEAERRIFCDILSYEVGEAFLDANQQSLSRILTGIDRITFRSIDTAGLLQTLAGKTKHVAVPNNAIEENAPSDPLKVGLSESPASSPPVRKPSHRTNKRISEEFRVPLKDLRFRLGGVSFTRKLKGHPEPLDLTVPNHDIREEFDAVKNYFAKVMGTDRIRVRADVEILGGRVVMSNATSPDIDRINREAIDNVKFEFVKSSMKRKLEVDIDKSLFTMDEYMDRFGEDGLHPNAFHRNERELFEDILSVSDSIHYRHLRFLSEHHAYDIMKLRFVLKPFSFIFLLRGDRHHHIVWETLDTEEATYVWHVTGDIEELKRTLRKVEDIVNVVKVQGKTAYIHSGDEGFRRIYHDYSALVDGFVKWKGELESVLT